MRPRALVDVDGVLCDFLGPALSVMNRIVGASAELKDMKSWHLFDAFDFEVTAEQQKTCYDYWKQPGWCRQLPLYDDAKEGIAALLAVADVLIVTSPMDGPTWVHEREAWLKYHFGFTRKDIIHTDAKWAVAGDILVDDKTEHCQRWNECHPDGVGVRWHQVTNKGIPYTTGPTVHSWAGVMRQLEQINPYNNRGHRRWTHPTT